MIKIGPYTLEKGLILAPMAGVSDLPFRELCRDFGADLAVSEMLTSDSSLWHSRKSQQRLQHHLAREPRSVQIAGSEPEQMALAAQLNVERGAQIIDINMGCPAKKVCKKAAGSALLRDETLVKNILEAVTGAVNVPVTLKIRTGWSPEERNAITIAHIAEDAGISAIAIHGRTRACRFNGEAEYATIASVVNSVSIPVFANGDIDSPQKAKAVLAETNAAGILIGRAAQGRPWIFQQIAHYLDTGISLAEPDLDRQQQTACQHVRALHEFYGPIMGVKIARKHVAWYLQDQPVWQSFKSQFNQITEVEQQLKCLQKIYNHCTAKKEIAA